MAGNAFQFIFSTRTHIRIDIRVIQWNDKQAGIWHTLRETWRLISFDEISKYDFGAAFGREILDPRPKAALCRDVELFIIVTWKIFCRVSIEFRISNFFKLLRQVFWLEVTVAFDLAGFELPSRGHRIVFALCENKKHSSIVWLNAFFFFFDTRRNWNYFEIYSIVMQ